MPSPFMAGHGTGRTDGKGNRVAVASKQSLSVIKASSS